VAPGEHIFNNRIADFARIKPISDHADGDLDKERAFYEGTPV
jgi:hypothetical protein